VLIGLGFMEVFLKTEVNAKFKAFMSSSQHFFYIAFPAKLICKKGLLRNGWITKGTKITSKK
jgi:hypothetical protein